MQIPIEQMIQICLRELKSKVKLISVGFVLISVVVVLIGSTWPRMYESSVTILADQGRLVGQTLGDNVQNAGAMVTTREATELMFSRQVLDRILEVGGWLTPNMSQAQKETLQKTIRDQTEVDITGNLLKISYSDPDPRRAFLVATEFGEQFIRQTAATSLQASRETYEFVDEQVNDYHSKLQEAEEALKNFRSAVVDASPERKAQSFSTIENLERDLRQSRLDLKEARITEASLQEQIAAEGNKSSSSSTAALYKRRLQEMQNQLDILRLSFHEIHPDIVSLKQQIADMKQAIIREEDRFQEDLEQGRDTARAVGGYSTLYDRLRGELSSVKTQIKTIQARISEYEVRLEEEKNRAQKMGEGQAREAELVRDYQVNQEYYQNLLRRRENARLSMNLALQEAGLSYKVQEKANFPQVPKGLRFLHFVLAGPLLGIIGPIAFFVALIQIDPRIRSSNVIEEDLGLPLLGVVPQAQIQKGLLKSDYSVILGALVGVGLLYVIIVVMHTSGVQLAGIGG